MLNRILAVLCIISLCCSALDTIAQDNTYKVILDEQGRDDRQTKMMFAIPVFQLHSSNLLGNSFEDNREPPRFDVKLPDMSKYKDTGYAFIYFKGADIKSNPGYVTIIIGNHSTVAPPDFFIDYNYNQDLSDDGPPVTFKFINPYLEIVLKNTSVPNGTFTYRLSRFDFSGKSSYRKMLESYYKQTEQERKFVGIGNSYREQRLNVKAGTFISATDTFRIGLFDGDFNGLYNDPEFDKILLTDPNSEVFQSSLDDQAIPIPKSDEDPFRFEWQLKQYEVKEVDPAGQHITLKENTNATLEYALKAGSKAPNIKFKLWDDEKSCLRKYQKRPTYLFIWKSEYPDFAKDTAIFHQIKKKYSDRIQLVSLYYGINPKQVEIMVNYGYASWVNGFATRKTNEQLKVKNLPTGILLNKRRRVENYGMTPGELLKYLQSQ